MLFVPLCERVCVIGEEHDTTDPVHGLPFHSTAPGSGLSVTAHGIRARAGDDSKAGRCARYRDRDGGRGDFLRDATAGGRRERRDCDAGGVPEGKLFDVPSFSGRQAGTLQ